MTKRSLAQENALLKVRLAEVEAALADAQEAQRRLETILGQMQREKFGKRSEKLSPEQFNLPMEDVELAQGVLEAAQEKAEAALKGKPAAAGKPRTRNRGHLPAHLPRVERIIEPASLQCGCGEMARIGEDVSERLDVIPAQFRVLVTRLTRKNALFAGHEVGAENWAMLASIIATCKMADVDPVAYIEHVLCAILDGHPKSKIDDLMPWNFHAASRLAA